MNHFELFGLSPSVDVDVPSLNAKYHELALANHPDRNPDDRVGAASRTASINEAFKVLKDPARRAIYLVQLGGVDLDRLTLPMDFLEKILEQREQLELARLEKNLAKVRGLGAEVAQQSDETLAAAQAALRQGDLSTAVQDLAKVRYFGRFLEEVEAIEEEAA